MGGGGVKGKEGLNSKEGAASLDGHQCSGCGGERGEDWRRFDRTLSSCGDENGANRIN